MEIVLRAPLYKYMVTQMFVDILLLGVLPEYGQYSEVDCHWLHLVLVLGSNGVSWNATSLQYSDYVKPDTVPQGQ